MKLIISSHAKTRMAERDISLEKIKLALQSPTKIEYDSGNKLLIKKIMTQDSKLKLLLSVGELQLIKKAGCFLSN